MRACLVGVVLMMLAGRLAAQAPARADGLQVMLMPTIQYAHADIWNRTPNGRGPAFAAANQVVRGQPVHLVVSAALFATDPERMAEVTYRIRSVRPDGRDGAGTGDLKLIPRMVIEDSRLIRLAAEQSAWSFDADDPSGTWRLILEAKDRVGGRTVRVEQPITLCDDDLVREALPAGTDLGRWLMNYHFRPTPHQLLGALQLAAGPPPAGARPRRDVENGAWLGFFEQVLADNPWLLPHLTARLEASGGREQELLATSIAYAERDDHRFHTSLGGKAREVFMRHRLQNWPVPDPAPTKAVQLDVLWGRFFASGRYAPIRDLAALLAYHPFRDAPDEFKKHTGKPATLPVEVTKGLVFRALVWSLGSNIQRDKVVRDYCEGILLRQELPETEQGWLASIFRKAVEPKPAAGVPPAGKD